MEECKWFHSCDLRRLWKQGRLEEKWVKGYCLGNWSKCKRYQAVENGKAYDRRMLPNGKIGKSLGL